MNDRRIGRNNPFLMKVVWEQVREFFSVPAPRPAPLETP